MEEDWDEWKQSYSLGEIGVVRMSLYEISHMDFSRLTVTRIKTNFFFKGAKSSLVGIEIRLGVCKEVKD